MVSSVSGSGAAAYVGVLLSSLRGNGSSGGSGGGTGTDSSAGQDTLYLSSQAQLLLSLTAALDAAKGTATSADQIMSLAAQLGPVVVSGDGSGPTIEVTRRGPDMADATLNRLAAILQGGADPGPGVSSGYFGSVRTGEGNDAVLAGDPTAPADPAGGLAALVSTGEGDDTITVNGNALVRGGTGNDSITSTGGSLLVNFGFDDGNDTVETADGPLGLLMAGVEESRLLVAQEGNDLVLRIHDTNDSLTIRNYRAAQEGYIRLADGTKTLAELTAGLNFTA
ncbi:hypothetical protein JYK14_12880 [Siccirubricoccus sp. KC 17139]|uniref:Haemolysin-type calcium binding-related domain-containing protein n=1 Tax=Siccirubricoccus soli TaxID=2899147 RepID=A0ABT1D552_9PROT|nr:calcium-binding protein [Siccirubricoccus soli]MCO6417050.1 hypothetical protein [Siccirubricoccus soli]MCP2683185.1 hypothetical protein [Siccirubricoccus soli]